MADPWLTLIGMGEDGLAGLSQASRAALDAAEIVFGGPRHLALAQVDARGQPWPVPFSIAPVLAARGRRVAVLASGDPFWHGAGGSLVQALSPGEWLSHPAPSTFQLAANRLGWRMEEAVCLGLHAAPLERMRPVLGQGQRLILTLRDGAAVAEAVAWLRAEGFAASRIHALEALGGPRERIVGIAPDQVDLAGFSAPVVLAVEAQGRGMPRASGLDDGLFDHDGQITRRPVRALTLSALAPRAGEVFWDIGTGSGSVAIEVLLAAPGSVVHGVEADPARAARARGNADRFGLGHRYRVTEARAPAGLADLPPPDAVFIGGGASAELLDSVWARLPPGGRLVANAVTLESEALFYDAQARRGGTLMKIDLAEMAPLGRRRGWEAARTVVQWSVTK
jgi:precorrin-6Y C5,15-methyltransferase (decarboxylating)